MPSTDYLDEERRKIWKEVVSLKESLIEVYKLIDSNMTTDVKAAKQASKDTSMYKNKAQSRLEEAEAILSEIIKLKEQSISNSKVSFECAGRLKSELSELTESLDRYKALMDKVSILEGIFENKDDIETKLKNIEGFHAQASDNNSKINSLHKSTLTRKGEVDEVYYEIMGYEDTDESGEIVKTPGLKEILEAAYSQLKQDAELLKKEISKASETSSESYKKYQSTTDKLIKDKISSWDAEHSATTQKIRALLPDALTAGLSHAYSVKKEDEVNSGKRIDKFFITAIISLVAVSLIPFSVGVYFFNGDKTLEQTIALMPKLVMSILPVYIPILWLAYSANKRLNLSKRLVEEYTHKEVLSKTYEGLSSQIESIKDKSVSAELRTKLLFNLLDVSSENPGKLITDYQKSDHPVIDALEKGTKLSVALEKVEKLPGIQKLLELLENKRNEKISRENAKVSSGLSAVDGKSDS